MDIGIGKAVHLFTFSLSFWKKKQIYDHIVNFMLLFECWKMMSKILYFRTTASRRIIRIFLSKNSYEGRAMEECLCMTCI